MSLYRVIVTVIELLVIKQLGVSDEDEDGSQDEGDEQLDVNVVPGAVQLPGEILRLFHRLLSERDSFQNCVKKKVNNQSYLQVFSLEEAEYSDSDGERDERQCVASCVHRLHVEEVRMGV